MMDSDDFADALRRELGGCAVPHNDDRAGAMIRTATAADPIGTRSWAAPLATAAAVVMVSGGSVVLIAGRNDHGSPSGGRYALCGTEPPTSTAPPSAPASSAYPTPAVSSSAVPPSAVPPSAVLRTAGPATAAPSTAVPTGPANPSTAVPATPTIPGTTDVATPGTSAPVRSTGTPTQDFTASGDPCTPTPSPSAPETTLPTPVSTPDRTPSSASETLPTASVGTPDPAPSYAPPTATRPGDSSAGKTVFDLTARPGEVTEQTTALPAGGPLIVSAAHLVSVSGTSGSIEVLRGATRTVMHDTVGSFTEETITPKRPVSFTAQNPPSLKLSCTGATTCHVRVTLDLG